MKDTSVMCLRNSIWDMYFMMKYKGIWS
jgi:hypothetical protein